MATTLLTKYQNRRKTGQLGQQYRGAVGQYGQARQRYKMQSQALSGLQRQHKSAVTHAGQTEQAKTQWNEQFWTGTEQGKGLNTILTRYTGLGININPDMKQQDVRSTLSDAGFGQGMGAINALQKEYDHSLTRTYTGTRWKDMTAWERMTTSPSNWYESYDTTASERQKRKDALTGFKGTKIGGLDFTWGDLSSDLSNWGSFKGSQTYKDYMKGKQTRDALDYSADTAVSDFVSKIQSATETKEQYKVQYGMAQASMKRMQSMYHGQRVRDVRAGSQSSGKQKRSSILLGYA